MSRLPAFNNNPQTKQQLIQRLEDVLAQQSIRPDNVVWNGESGSLCGSIARAELDEFERLTGIPVAIAMLADKLCREDEQVGSDWARHWFSAIQPGADVSQSEAHFTQWLLTGPNSPLAQAQAFSGGIGENTAPLLIRLNELHTLGRQGQPVEAQHWSALQEQAITLSDSRPDAHFTRQLCSFVEALSWPVGSSVTALIDAVEALRGATYFFSMMHCGWESAWEQKTDDLYRRYDEEIAARGLADSPPSAELAVQVQAVFDELAAQVPGYNQILADMRTYRHNADLRVRDALVASVG